MSSCWLPSSSCTSQAGTQTSLLFVTSVVVVNDCIGAGCCCSVWTLLCERHSATRGVPSKGAMCHGLTRLAFNHWSIRCQIFPILPVAPSGIHVAQAPQLQQRHHDHLPQSHERACSLPQQHGQYSGQISQCAARMSSQMVWWVIDVLCRCIDRPTTTHTKKETLKDKPHTHSGTDTHTDTHTHSWRQ